MIFSRLAVGSVVGALCLTASGLAYAEGGVALSGAAPVVCKAGMEGAASASGPSLALGELSEFCNDPNGYEVWIEYPADLAGATLVLGSERLTLTNAGSARVSTTNSPQTRVRRASLEGMGPLQRNPILSIRVSPASGGQSTVAAR